MPEGARVLVLAHLLGFAFGDFLFLALGAFWGFFFSRVLKQIQVFHFFKRSVWGFGGGLVHLVFIESHRSLTALV